MLIRPYETRDRGAIERIHKAQGFGYALPDFAQPIFLTKLVMQGERAEVIAAAALKITAEAYFLIDPDSGSPQDRLFALTAVHEAVRRDAYAGGLEDVHAFVPPQISKAFGRRLHVLGWQREPWVPWCRKVEGATWPVA